MNQNLFYDIGDAKKKIGAWKNEYNSPQLFELRNTECICKEVSGNASNQTATFGSYDWYIKRGMVTVAGGVTRRTTTGGFICAGTE